MKENREKETNKLTDEQEETCVEFDRQTDRQTGGLAGATTPDTTIIAAAPAATGRR